MAMLPTSLFPLILPPPAAHGRWWDHAVEQHGDRTLVKNNLAEKGM